MKPLRVLMVEDRAEDLELVQLALERGGIDAEIRWVETPPQLEGALREDWQIVLSDCSMPTLRARDVIERIKAQKPWLPVIVVSGTIGEEQAVDLLKCGAADFVSKMNLARLVPAIHREISDAQARRERADALAALQEAIRARDDFLVIAAHELKTPVTALKLQVGMLRKATTVETAQGVESVARITDRIDQLISRLLDITEFTGKRPDVVPTTIDVAHLLRERVYAVHAEAARIGSAIDLDLPPRLEMKGDGRLLGIAFANLVQNAVKYGDGKPIRVSARERGGVVFIDVEDHGLGISPEDQERIFQRFGRAVPRERFGGFGLGLWIARESLEAHGGTIRVRSEPRKGSCFTVELPMR